MGQSTPVGPLQGQGKHSWGGGVAFRLEGQQVGQGGWGTTVEAAQGPDVTLEKYFPCSMFPPGKWSKHPRPAQFPRALWHDDDKDDDDSEAQGYKNTINANVRRTLTVGQAPG